MQSLILTLHIIVCVLLVILILLQAGKEGMGVIFGGGNSSVFGSTGAGGILVKLTTLMALIFVVTSLSYTYVTSEHTSSESTILDVQIEGGPSAVPAGQPATTEPSAATTIAPPATPENAPSAEPKAPEAATEQEKVSTTTPSEAAKEPGKASGTAPSETSKEPGKASEKAPSEAAKPSRSK